MKLKFFLANIFLFIFNVFAFATDGDGWDDDTTLPSLPPGKTPPPPTEDTGAQATPIDMYEWMLLGIATILIVAYYYYSKRRRIVN